jgi:serine/threonine protein kinase
MTQTNETLQAFHQWRLSSEAHLSGFGGPTFGTRQSFIPRSHLEEYFGRSRRLENLLDVVLDASKRPEIAPNLVRLHYLRCFATLLCIGEGSLISLFYQHQSLRDEKLPFRARPDEFPTTSPDKFKAFQDAQWQFCALNLEYGMDDRFKADDIVPIIHMEKIGEGGSAIIYKIVVDQNYNSLRPPSHAIAVFPAALVDVLTSLTKMEQDHRQQCKNTFVLKTYREAEAEKSYKAERKAHMSLRLNGKPSPHIIACYGGFIHGNSYNLILEYADGGTLETFMRKTKPPSTIEDVLFFWDRLSDITHGIMCIHQTSRIESSPSQRLNGWVLRVQSGIRRR